MREKISNSWVFLTFLSLFFIQASAEYAFIHVRNENGSTKDFCVAYNPLFSTLPEGIGDDYRRIDDLLPSYLCEGSPTPSTNGSSILLAKRGNCTFYEKGKIAQSYGSAGVLVATEQLITPDAGNISQYSEVNITVALILNEDAIEIQNFGRDVEGVFYAPELMQSFDYDMLLMWVLAMFTVIVGSYWSGLKGFQIMKGNLKASGNVQQEGDEKNKKESGESDIHITPLMVGIFVIVIVTMMILLYFFYNVLVFVVIIIFVISSTLGLYTCFEPLVKKIPFLTFRLHRTWCGGGLEARLVLLGLACAALTITWAVFRKESFAWILQDFMGITFCIYMLTTLRLPSFKICVLLLVSLLVYDVFFVFITPYMTKDGKSIMVEVATGGSDRIGGSGGPKEEIPIVLKIPHFSHSLYDICDSSSSYSILGYGDIIVPSLLVSYCSRFDFFVKSPMAYFISSCIGYGVGLLVCFVALFYMRIGQPALLYLVPCTILASLMVACIRRELRLFWAGNLVIQSKEENSEGDGYISESSDPKLTDEDDDQQPLMNQTD